MNDRLLHHHFAKMLEDEGPEDWWGDEQNPESLKRPFTFSEDPCYNTPKLEEMSCMKGLYVDDVRVPSETYNPAGIDWTIARSFHEAIYLLETNQYDVVSLDHDLGFGSFYGMKELTGYDIVRWMIYRKMDGRAVPRDVRVHSANTVRAPFMQAYIYKYLNTE